MNLEAFNARWLGNDGGERANKDPFLNDLCDLMVRATSPRSFAALTASFAKAKPKDAEGVLESLASLGLLVSFDGPEARVWQGGAGRCT